MLLLKIFISAFIVIGLAELAERSSTKMAGLLAGLPVGSALVLFFYALDYGVFYVKDVASYNLLGLSASLTFVIMYYVGSNLFKKYSLFNGIFFGLTSYFIMAYFLSALHVEGALVPSIILFTVIMASTYYFRNIKVVNSTKSGKLNSSQLLIRGAIAVFFVLIASYSPQYASDEMAGVLSSFPSAILPLLIIIHYSQGKEVVHSVIKYLPLGYVGVMLYSIVIGNLYVDYGVYTGTLLALGVSTTYLVLLLVIPNIYRKISSKV